MVGVPSTLDPADRSFGPLRWKPGTGGQVGKTPGKWERPLGGTTNRGPYRASQMYPAPR